MELLTNSTVLVKTPESDNQTQPPTKLSNGVFKHHPIVITYKQCLKNHAAALGAHAVDGCGEFMSSPTSNPDEPTSLKCAACGCHRNFHRRQPEEPLLLLPPPQTLEFRPHHRHHPPPPPGGGNISSSENSPSPPPISSAYYPSSVPHMLMFALNNSPISTAVNGVSINLLNSNRKRSRTRFTQDQKVKMLELAERLEWKMQKKDEDLINQFCSEIGVEKGVFRVWMHNNKSISSKKDHNIAMSTPPAVNNHVNGVSYDDVNDDRKENVVGNNSTPSISR